MTESNLTMIRRVFPIDFASPLSKVATLKNIFRIAEAFKDILLT